MSQPWVWVMAVAWLRRKEEKEKRVLLDRGSVTIEYRTSPTCSCVLTLGAQLVALV